MIVKFTPPETVVAPFKRKLPGLTSKPPTLSVGFKSLNIIFNPPKLLSKKTKIQSNTTYVYFIILCDLFNTLFAKI